MAPDRAGGVPPRRRRVPALSTTLLCAALCALGGTVRADRTDTAPLSAIPWLSETLRAPGSGSDGTTGPENAPAAPGELPATPAPPADGVEVTPLGAPGIAATGLMTPAGAGLSADLWAGADADEAAAALAALPPASLPAVQDVARALLLVEAAPADAGPDFFLARIDALLRRGDLAPAQALLEAARPGDPALFRRWFDILMLTGAEDRACATLAAAPEIAPNYPVEVFCLARSGRWHTAALTLGTASALGGIETGMQDRLARFLDPEIYEGAPPPPRPDPVTPLDYKLMEAVGEAPATGTLPVAFAHLDLRPVVGWGAQIAAAERLAAAGALDVNRLLELYTRRLPRGVGGVWERARLVQALDVALTTGHADEIAAILSDLQAAMAEAGLGPVAARMFAPRLARQDLAGAARAVAAGMALASNTDAALAPPRAAGTLPDRLAFATALAAGTAPPVAAPTPLASALRRALTAPPPARDTTPGLALAAAVTTLAAPDPAPADAARAIATLRAAGLDRPARHAALQLLAAERPK